MLIGFYRRRQRLQKGFTLIELLIVIAIIAMLASIVITALAPVRQKANDAKRVSDVKQLASALELYASDHNGTYPIMTTPDTLDKLSTMYADPNLQLVPKYIPKIPVAPNPPAPGHTATENSYLYQSDAAGTTYNIQVTLSAPVGSGPSAIPAGVNHISNSSNGRITPGSGLVDNTLATLKSYAAQMRDLLVAEYSQYGSYNNMQGLTWFPDTWMCQSGTGPSSYYFNSANTTRKNAGVSLCNQIVTLAPYNADDTWAGRLWMGAGATTPGCTGMCTPKNPNKYSIMIAIPHSNGHLYCLGSSGSTEDTIDPNSLGCAGNP